MNRIGKVLDNAFTAGYISNHLLLKHLNKSSQKQEEDINTLKTSDDELKKTCEMKFRNLDESSQKQEEAIRTVTITAGKLKEICEMEFRNLHDLYNESNKSLQQDIEQVAKKCGKSVEIIQNQFAELCKLLAIVLGHLPTEQNLNIMKSEYRGLCQLNYAKMCEVNKDLLSTMQKLKAMQEKELEKMREEFRQEVRQEAAQRMEGDKKVLKKSMDYTNEKTKEVLKYTKQEIDKKTQADGRYNQHTLLGNLLGGGGILSGVAALAVMVLPDHYKVGFAVGTLGFISLGIILLVSFEFKTKNGCKSRKNS